MSGCRDFGSTSHLVVPAQTGDEESTVPNIALSAGLHASPNYMYQQLPSTVQRDTAFSGGSSPEATQDKRQGISSLTQRQYAGHVDVFRDWLRAKGFPTDFEHRPPKELNDELIQFYQESETRTGCKRKASSLRIIRTGIDHHLQGEPYCWPFSLTRSTDFVSSNAVLHQLENLEREAGTTLPFNRKRNVVAIKPQDLHKLWASGVIGITGPKPLQRLVFLVIAVNFGITTRDFLHDLGCDVFEFGIDESTGLEYAQCKAIRPEECFKQLSKCTKYSPKKVFSIPGCTPCPVSALKLYLKKRNPACTAFFQVPYRDVVAGCPGGGLWYKAEATGVNTLSRMMKDMSEEAALSMSYTNNSLRGTSPVALFQAIADCSAGNSLINPCEKQASNKTVLCTNYTLRVDRMATSTKPTVDSVLPGNWHAPILPCPSSAVAPSPESCNEERTVELNSNCTGSNLCRTTQKNPAFLTEGSVAAATTTHPVLCIPQQWEIRDIIAALNSGEALLLAKQPATKTQNGPSETSVPVPTRSSRKQSDPKRLRRDPENGQESTTPGADISWMEVIMAMKSKMNVLEGLIQRDSAPAREVFSELQQLRRKLDSILAQVYSLDCDDV